MNPSIFHFLLFVYLTFFIRSAVSTRSTNGNSLYLRGRSDPAAKVESCGEHTVTLTFSSKTQSPKIGTLLVVVPPSLSKLYEECEFLARQVIAVKNLDATDNSQHVSIELQTQPAFIRDLIDISVFSHLRDFPSDLPDDMPLELIIRHEADKNHVQTLGHILSSDLHDLHDLSVRQAFPSSCSKWFVVSKSGRCVYSGCKIGRNGKSSQCFACGRKCDNGCSSVPDSVGNIFDFSKACCSHDHCYSSSFSRKTCDDGFLVDMEDSCGSDSACSAAAYTYYLGVRVLGNSAYKKRQSALRRHLRSSKCK